MEDWTVTTSDYKYAHSTVWQDQGGNVEAKIELWEYSNDNHEIVVKINTETINRIRVVDASQKLLLDTGEDNVGSSLGDGRAFGGSLTAHETRSNP